MGDHFGKTTAVSLIYFLNYAYLAIWPCLLFFGTRFTNSLYNMFLLVEIECFVKFFEENFNILLQVEVKEK